MKSRSVCYCLMNQGLSAAQTATMYWSFDSAALDPEAEYSGFWTRSKLFAILIRSRLVWATKKAARNEEYDLLIPSIRKPHPSCWPDLVSLNIICFHGYMHRWIHITGTWRTLRSLRKGNMRIWYDWTVDMLLCISFRPLHSRIQTRRNPQSEAEARAE